MSPNNTRLSGRTALVTGSTGGLGVALAKALAADGAFVVVSGRNKSRGDAVVTDIRSAGGDAVFVGADLAAGEGEVRRVAAAATEAADGHLDLSAAAPADRELLTDSVQAFRQVAAVLSGQQVEIDLEPVEQARIASASHLRELGR